MYMFSRNHLYLGQILKLDNLEGKTELPGEYVCEAEREETGDFKELRYTFDVQYKPVVSLNATSGITKQEGETFAIKCNADAKPAGTIQWFRDATALDGETNATISRSDVTFVDNGTYRCEVTNQHGVTKSAVDVSIVKLPEASISEGSNNEDGSRTLNINEGKKLKLTCKASGEPKPSVFKWTLPDGTTTDAPTYSSGTLYGANLAIFILFSDSATEAENGLFRCEAWNEVNGQRFGPGSAEISVNVTCEFYFLCEVQLSHTAGMTHS